jgi:hypothetical protein
MKQPRYNSMRACGEEGFAIIIVLLVLLALLVLCTPFLLAARNADRASAELAERSSARLALDSAARLARSRLSATHPSQDKTPLWDELGEVEIKNRFDPRFLDANDPHGVMWDLEVGDVAGKIDLNSASPQVIANLIDASVRWADVIARNAKKLPVSSTSGFLPSGFVWSGGELIRYGKLGDGELLNFQRGVLCPSGEKDWRGGPTPPADHGNGAPVLDQRAYAPALWRLSSADGELHRFSSMEELRQARDFVLAAALVEDGSPAPKSAEAATPARAGADTSAAPTRDELWGEATLRALYANGSVFGGVRGGHVWQRAARVTDAIEGRKDGRIRVDNVRWFNAGSTIRISDGSSTEMALVTFVTTDGWVVLDRLLTNDYAAYTAEVRVLARRPVNLNTARPEVLKILFTNLQILGRNSRITKDRAQQLADLVVQSRPFIGHEDFLRRIVLPAAGLEKLPADAEVHPDAFASGSGFLDPYEALALYTNGLNANDASLAYSTMPYCFTTRDTYDLELRASVNAPSGVERFSLVRDEVDMVTPQTLLFALWSRQEDFDDALRLDCEAPWWSTGPSATSRWDHGSVPPSRLWSHMGTYAGKTFLPGVSDPADMESQESKPTAEHVFASREKDGWIQMWPSRVDELGQRKGRVMHFDHETRDPEGRYLPDEPIQRSVDDKQVLWSGKSQLMQPISFSLWVKPRSLSDATLMDVMSGLDLRADRVSLLFEQGDLILRVIDGVGDHPVTTEKEVGEVRYQLATGSGPGLPVEIWSHIEVDVRGNQPHQMSMLVNGLDHGVRTLGLTRLTGSASQGAALIPVESVEGFPPHCTVRIGNELMEVTVSGGQLKAERQQTGEFAGFGGRIAREPFIPSPGDNATWIPEPAVLNGIATDHPSGTPVELYGYSLPVKSDVPTGNSTLGANLGPFQVARLIGVVGGGSQGGEPIQSGGGTNTTTWGLGMKAQNSMVNGLMLDNADRPGAGDQEFMNTFQTAGGYAAIIQYAWVHDSGDNRTNDGDILGGVEVIRYSGYDGTTLHIAARGDAVPQLQNLQNLSTADQKWIGGRRAFIAQWNPSITLGIQGTVHVKDLLNWQAYVVPISLGVPGSGQVNGYLAAKTQDSRFAQLTHVQDAENTEWVRYDWFDTAFSQLVRDDPPALHQAYFAVVAGAPSDGTDPPQPPSLEPPGPQGGTGGGAQPPGAVAMDAGSTGGDDGLALPALTAAAPAPPVQTQTNYSQWDPRIGKNESIAQPAPISDAVSSGLQFRGAFGTYTHKHPAGTPILPVFMTDFGSPDRGRPGRLDTAFLVGANIDHIGWPVRVHRAYIPGTLVPRYAWKQDTPPGQSPNPQPIVDQPQTSSITQDGYLVDPAKMMIYVALQEKSPELIVHGSASGSTTQVVDTRALARLVCYPSGERPRAVTHMSVGGGASGAQGGVVPSAVVDEVVFGDAKFGMPASTDPDASAGASLILNQDLAEAGTSMRVAPSRVRMASGQTTATPNFLGMPVDKGGLRKDGGLLRIGDEILAYNSRDPSNGTITLAPNGRGLLGTRPQNHQATEPILYLEHHTVTSLTGDVSATDAILPVADVTEFPNEGTVLIGSELIHYTRLRDGRLEMPRASSVPGAMDAKGDGLFRGRFGTPAETHTPGEAVILFPIRYWDRWAARADAPELAYFSLGIDQPAAFWESFFFDKTDTDAGNIGVLQRTSSDAPWDADPEKDKRVQLFWKGDVEGQPIPIGVQSDAIEWRVFVKYAPNAFDVKTGLPHGWTQTPRLRQLGAFYYGPNVVLRSVER